MRQSLTLAVTLALTTQAVAQNTGAVQDISVLGTTELLSNYVKAILSVQPGTPVSDVNLKKVEKDVMDTGYFKSVIAELKTVSGKETLTVKVAANAQIGQIDVEGMEFLPASSFKKSIADLMNIAPGATLNTQRLNQAKEALIKNYEQEGFPVKPQVTIKTSTAKDGSAVVKFVVDETASVKRIEIRGASLLPKKEVASIFQPIYEAKKFTTPLLYQTMDKLKVAYEERGVLAEYRRAPLAGIAPGGLSLVKGVLKVRINEAKVSRIDLSKIPGLDKAPVLKTKQGQAIKSAELEDDIRHLSNLTQKPVAYQLVKDPRNPNDFILVFGITDMEGGPVKSIEFVGNTKVSRAQLIAAMKTRIGDSITPVLVERDFVAIRDVYRDEGYEISARDPIQFKDGKLTFNIREVKIGGFEIAWQGKHMTKDRVILRELPKVGGTFDNKKFRASLGRVARLGYVTVLGVRTKPDPKEPEKVTYIIQLKEKPNFNARNLALTYDTKVGWGGDIGVEWPNVAGLGHLAGVNVNANRNDAGQGLSGSVKYTIPWLELGFGDFKEKRTTLNLSAGSHAVGNNALLRTITKDGKKEKIDSHRDYTTRSTGVSASLSRQLSPNLSGSIGTSFNYRTYYLESIRPEDKEVKKNPDKPNEKPKAIDFISDKEALGLLPKEGFTTTINGGLGFDNTDHPSFPGRGIRANSNIAVNFGTEGQKASQWTDVEAGIRGYYGFGNTKTRSDGSKTYENVLAGRANVGTMLGAPPEGESFYIGGANMLHKRELRGLEDGQLFGTNYLTSSIEYRRDLGLSGGFSQGIYAIVFADYGGAWNNNQDFSSNWGAGVGLQFNLALGSAALPTLRFDYAFSPTNQKNTDGRFHFRIGDVW